MHMSTIYYKLLLQQVNDVAQDELVGLLPPASGTPEFEFCALTTAFLYTTITQMKVTKSERTYR